jgi:hypothetical protein
METLRDKNQQKSAFKFYCENCDYGTCRKSNYDDHLDTDKHRRVTLGLKMRQTSAKNQQNILDTFICTCGNKYKHRQGLWRHKKTCTNINIQDLANEDKQQQLIEYLLKENSEFKQLMIEQQKHMLEQNKHMIELAKNAGHNTTNSHNTTNNSFNLQFFLNETCKDAMNIMDFVSQLQVGLKDLEETGRLGFANGISKIFINGLKQINVNDRPIHCSDLKRETLYIKNNNEWNKEDEEKKLLTNALKHVAHKNIKQISEWTKEHPGFNDPDSKVNDRYLKIVSESMSGSTEDETNKNYTKIIKNIVKETVIDK